MGVVGAFGNKTFEVSANKIYTFDGLSISESINVEMQEVEANKPATYIKGNGEMNIGFDILLLSRFCDVDYEIDYWLLKMRSVVPEYLTIGKKAYGTNKFLLTNVSVGDVLIAADGTKTRAKVTLTFSEWTKAGYKKDDKSTTTSTSTSATTSGTTTKKNTTSTTTTTTKKVEENPFSGLLKPTTKANTGAIMLKR